MSSHLDTPQLSLSVLLPVMFPDPGPIDPGLMRVLGPLKIHLLGCYSVPEQTAPEQAREQFEQETRESLSRTVEKFAEYAGEVDFDVIFTPDPAETTRRVATDLEVDAIVRPKPTGDIASIVAVATDTMEYSRFVEVLSALAGDDITDIRVLKLMPADRDIEKETLIRDGLYTQLIEHGISPEILDISLLEPPDSPQNILDRIQTADLAILGEYSTAIGDAEAQRISESALEQLEIPLLVVPQEPEG